LRVSASRWPDFLIVAIGQVYYLSTLFDKIPLVTRIALDQREKLHECLIPCLFVMDCQCGHHHKTCPPYKLLFPLTPLFSLLIGIGRFIKEIPTDLVAYIPCINIVDPLLHKLGSDKLRLGDHRGKDSCLMDP